MKLRFRRSKPCGWVIAGAQFFNAIDLSWRCRVKTAKEDLRVLRKMPKKQGLIIAINHADEMDVKVCLEISRRSGKRFIFMINSEAFEEGRGWAGWWLQRLGGFSVERGGSDEAAKEHAVKVIRSRKQALVIFPEGEIHYLADTLQPFKSGLIHLGMEALQKDLEKYPEISVAILPIALKYRYRGDVARRLDRRIRKIEKRLFRNISYASFQERLSRIWAAVLRREDLLNRAPLLRFRHEELKQEITEVRKSVVSEMESKYKQVKADPRAQLIDRARKLIFHLRQRLSQKKLFSPEARKEFHEDMGEIRKTVQMEGWHPAYADLNPTEERLAETIFKLEREIFGIRRPKPLANRRAYVKICAPINLNPHLADYQTRPSETAKNLAEEIRSIIQSNLARI